MEVQQCMEQTDTNRSRAYPHKLLQQLATNVHFASSFQGITSLKVAIRLVMMAKGNHAFPSRTRPLSPSAPMVLGPQGPGRVGRCQAQKDSQHAVGLFSIYC